MDLTTNHMFFLMVFLLHLWISYAAGCWFYNRFNQEPGQAKLWKWLVTVFSFFIPIYGPLGFAIIYSLRAGKKNNEKESIIVEFEEHLQHIKMQPNASDQMVNHDWKEIKEIQPIIEILRGTDQELQKGAIATLAVKGDMHSIKLLKDALGYADPEVRYFVVEALTKISKQYIDKICIGKTALEHDPDSAEKMFKLAACYYDLANCKIEDYALNQVYFEQAAFYFSEAQNFRELKDPEKIKYGKNICYFYF